MRLLNSTRALLVGLLVVSGLLILCLGASVRFGAAQMSTWDVLSAFVAFEGSEEDLIIRTLRVPRAMIAALVGAAWGLPAPSCRGLPAIRWPNRAYSA